MVGIDLRPAAQRSFSRRRSAGLAAAFQLADHILVSTKPLPDRLPSNWRRTSPIRRLSPRKYLHLGYRTNNSKICNCAGIARLLSHCSNLLITCLASIKGDPSRDSLLKRRPSLVAMCSLEQFVPHPGDLLRISTTEVRRAAGKPVTITE